MLTAITDGGVDALKTKYGVTPANSPTSRDRWIALNDYILEFKLEHNKILVAVMNDRVHGFPKRRTFLIGGYTNRPLLFEPGKAPEEVADFFNSIVAWFSHLASAHAVPPTQR